LNGTRRSNAIDLPFLSVPVDEHGHPVEKGNYAFTYFCTAVRRGLWMRGAVELCKREKIPIDLQTRGVESRWLVARERIYGHSPSFLKPYVNYVLQKLS